eukprot:gene28980-38338_t
MLLRLIYCLIIAFSAASAAKAKKISKETSHQLKFSVPTHAAVSGIESLQTNTQLKYATSSSLSSKPKLTSFGNISTFSHPGALNSKIELDLVKNQIIFGMQPCLDEYQKYLNNSATRAIPNALKTVLSTNNNQANTMRDNAFAAYTQALMWFFSGNDVYAARSIAILNAWTALTGFVSATDQDKLLAGWIGAVMAPAAEILRLYSGWQASDISKLQMMFKTVFYPQLNTMSSWNGNVDLTQIDAMMAIAVFNEDSNEFNKGIARLRNRIPAYFYLQSDGALPQGIAGDKGNIARFWSNPSLWVDGLTQETCRDYGHHSQFGIGSAIHAMETAWHQGVDVYTENTDRITAALELLAGFLIDGSMHGVCGAAANTPTSNRFDTWEVGYNHYHYRKGIPLPNTWKLITLQIRPYAVRSSVGWNLVYETLTHANLYQSPTSLPTNLPNMIPTSLPSTASSNLPSSLLSMAPSFDPS